jgi:hypothetical protein
MALLGSVAVEQLHNPCQFLLTILNLGLLHFQWDPKYRIKVRVICARAYHALFMTNS